MCYRSSCNAFVQTVVACHQGKAAADVVVHLSAKPVRYKARLRAARHVLPVILAPKVPSQNVQLVEEQVIPEDAGPPNGRTICELIGTALILDLVLRPSIHHESNSAVRTEPVIGVEPDVLGILRRIEQDLTAVRVQPIDR